MDEPAQKKIKTDAGPLASYDRLQGMLDCGPSGANALIKQWGSDKYCYTDCRLSGFGAVALALAFCTDDVVIIASGTTKDRVEMEMVYLMPFTLPEWHPHYNKQKDFLKYREDYIIESFCEIWDKLNDAGITDNMEISDVTTPRRLLMEPGRVSPQERLLFGWTGQSFENNVCIYKAA